MKAGQTTVLGVILKSIVPCGILLASNILMAQPPAPSFEGHDDFRSREPDDSSLTYDWSCGEIERSIEFNLRFRQIVERDGAPGVAATWGIGRYTGDGEPGNPRKKELSAFVSSLEAINYIAGRCFDTEGEVRISGSTGASHETVMRVFRVP